MNRIKKILVVVISTVFAIGTLCFIPNGVAKVNANTSTLKNINLGTSGIENPTAGGNATGNWEGSKIYFGAVNNQNLWRVLDATTGLVFADDVVEEAKAIDSYDVSDFDWENSALKAWLNGADYKLSTIKFSSVEQVIIDNINMLTNDDAQNTAYGFTNNVNASDTRKVASGWWLASPSNETSGGKASYVKNDGSIDLAGDRYFLPKEIRPTLTLDMSSILLTKASGAVMTNFDVISDDHVNANTWKLTLKDGDTSFTTATLPTTGNIGQSVTIDVTHIGNGTYNQTSAILEDDSGTIIAYGKIGDATAGEKTLNIPSTVTAGNYKLRIFQEQVNGNTLSDYASREITSAITLTNVVNTYDVNVVRGNHMTKTSASGNETQTGLNGAMTTVVYTADSGYYFPENYNVADTNGITVVRDNYTQISVMGTPTSNATITLPEATAKLTPLAPTNVTGDINKIINTTVEMEYAADANATTWIPCTPDFTSTTAGTWYVRYKETNTTKASNATQVSVTNTPSTYSVNVTRGNHMTKTSTSGNEMQTGLNGSMITIVYTADSGYYFAEDYHLTNTNGIIVTRNSFTQISISGIPSANVGITLPDATAKHITNAPTNVVGDINKIINTTTSMEYAADANATIWTTCTSDFTSISAGTWYVRYKETTTTKASDSIKVTVNPISTSNENPKTSDPTEMMGLLILTAVSLWVMVSFKKKRT